MLKIKNLHASVDGKEILKGINLEINAGEVHAIMGPNGAGKSTLSSVLTGRERFVVTEGSIEFNGKDLLALPAEDRAREGIFMSFQYPVEIPGVSTVNFMKTAVNEIRKYRGEAPYPAGDFLKMIRQKMELVGIDNKLLNRSLNEGFSGGEKKKNEIFQMAVLEPKLAILDETDSGLDIDARGKRREQTETPGHFDHRHHPLPAVAGLHRAGRGARAVRRQNREDGGQGVGGGTGRERIRLD